MSHSPERLDLSARQSPRALLLLMLSVVAVAALWVRPRQQVRAAVSARPALDHPDSQCRQCHQQIYDSYEKTPMAQGSGLALAGLTPREMARPSFTHAPSGITYRVSASNGEAMLTYTRDATPALHGQERLQYFIGSGRRGRTFLFEQAGLWFETPINWYGKKAVWDMAPAYDSVSSLPPPLPVDANCLHCHASDVQQATGGVRNHFDAAPFQAGGVGCAACHGDPAAHLDAVNHHRAGTGSMLKLDALKPVARDSICLQCHLEGDATVFRAGRSLASFRPGEDLSVAAVYFVDRNRAQQGLRASSQYEALLRSACKRATGDRLTCTTCHDPHSSPAPAERVQFFRGKCLACHNTPAIAVQHHPEQQDCAACHMPTRKTADISHEQLTDHDIEAHPAATSAAATVLRARLGTPDLVPVGPESVTVREEGLAYAQLAQASGNRDAGERALKLLLAADAGNSEQQPDAELHNQLGFLLQRAGRPAQAAAQYRATLSVQPQDITAAANLAVLEASAGHLPEAVRLLTDVVARDPSQTAAGLNLAFLECRLDHGAQARNTLDRVLSFNPGSEQARLFLRTGQYGNQTCRVP